MDGVSRVAATAPQGYWTNAWYRPLPEPRQVQNQNQNQRRSANRVINDDGFSNDANAGRRPLFEARARSTNGVYSFDTRLV